MFLNSVNTAVYKARSQNWEERQLASSVRPSVRMEQLGYLWRNFHYIWYLRIFRKRLRKLKIYRNRATIKGTFHEDQYIYIYIYHISLISSSNEKCFGKKMQRTPKHILCFQKRFLEICLSWVNVEKYCRGGGLQMTIRRTSISCWVTEATNTHFQDVQYLLFFHCNNGSKNAT